MYKKHNSLKPQNRNSQNPTKSWNYDIRVPENKLAKTQSAKHVAQDNNKK